MNIGDKTTNKRYGVNGTNIPVGAVVKYEGHVSVNGVSGPTWTMKVQMRDGKKVLTHGGRDYIHGQQGDMTILSLPEEAVSC